MNEVHCSAPSIPLFHTRNAGCYFQGHHWAGSKGWNQSKLKHPLKVLLLPRFSWFSWLSTPLLLQTFTWFLEFWKSWFWHFSQSICCFFGSKDFQCSLLLCLQWCHPTCSFYADFDSFPARRWGCMCHPLGSVCRLMTAPTKRGQQRWRCFVTFQARL